MMSFLKRALSLFFVLLLCATCAHAIEGDMLPPPSEAADQADYRVFIGGEYHAYDVPPEVTKDGVLLLPLYEILAADGAKVTVKGTEVKIKTRKKKTVRLNLSDGAVAGGEKKYQLTQKGKSVLIESGFFELVGGLQFWKDIYTKTIVVTSDGATYGDVTPYSLGTGELMDYPGTEIERAVPYDIAGAMAVPQAKQPVPVVVIIHGNHAIGKADETRYDLGFAYLLRALAAKGYAAFSINLAMHYSFEIGEPQITRQDKILAEHLTRLEKANNGEDAGFPFDLTGRLDLQNITFVGHSQGAGAGAHLATKINELGLRVNGIIEVSPSMMVPPLPCPDVPVGIFLGLQDDDVIAFDGAPTFDCYTRGDVGRTADTYLALVRGANHAAFDEALIPQDRAYAKLPMTAPAEQREFYKKFVTDFVEAVNHGGSLSALPSGADGDFYGQPALTAFYSGKGKDILMAGSSAAPTGAGGAEVTEITGGDAPIPVTFDPDDVIAAGGKLAGNNDMPLYQITWTKPGAQVTAPVAEAMQDFSAARALVLEGMQISGDTLNNKLDVPLTVTLTDGKGQTGSVKFDHAAALRWYETEYVGIYNTRDIPTFLSSLTIPLERFAGGPLDLRDIRTVTLDFAGSNSGSVLLRYLQLVPAGNAVVPPMTNWPNYIFLALLAVGLLCMIVFAALRARKRKH